MRHVWSAEAVEPPPITCTQARQLAPQRCRCGHCGRRAGERVGASEGPEYRAHSWWPRGGLTAGTPCARIASRRAAPPRSRSAVRGSIATSFATSRPTRGEVPKSVDNRRADPRRARRSMTTQSECSAPKPPILALGVVRSGGGRASMAPEWSGAVGAGRSMAPEWSRAVGAAPRCAGGEARSLGGCLGNGKRIGGPQRPCVPQQFSRSTGCTPIPVESPSPESSSQVDGSSSSRGHGPTKRLRRRCARPPDLGAGHHRGPQPPRRRLNRDGCSRREVGNERVGRVTRARSCLLANGARADAGLGKLSINSCAAKAARARAARALAKAHLEHEPLPDCGTGWAGENLARHYGTPKDMHDAWMASPGHRENILRPEFTGIGVGCVAYSRKDPHKPATRPTTWAAMSVRKSSWGSTYADAMAPVSRRTHTARGSGGDASTCRRLALAACAEQPNDRARRLGHHLGVRARALRCTPTSSALRRGSRNCALERLPRDQGAPTGPEHPPRGHSRARDPRRHLQPGRQSQARTSRAARTRPANVVERWMGSPGHRAEHPGPRLHHHRHRLRRDVAFTDPTREAARRRGEGRLRLQPALRGHAATS